MQKIVINSIGLAEDGGAGQEIRLEYEKYLLELQTSLRM